MGHPLRILGDGLCSHAIARCNNKAHHFTTDDERLRLLSVIAHYQPSLRFELHAYVIMSSHVHLLLTTRGEMTLDKVMHAICNTYARDAHARLKRTGHFWTARYRSKVVDTDNYALACLRYIDSNPCSAGMVAIPAQWPWSSHRVYADGTTDRIVRITPHESYLALADTAALRRECYRRLFAYPRNMPLETKLFEGKMTATAARPSRYLARLHHPVQKERGTF